MTFSWTHQSRATPEPLRKRPGTCLVWTREQMRMTPRVTLNLRQASTTTRWHNTLAQKMATTAMKKSQLFLYKLEQFFKTVEQSFRKNLSKWKSIWKIWSEITCWSARDDQMSINYFYFKWITVIFKNNYRTEIFLRFAVFLLISPVIPLIAPLIF